MNEFDHLPGQRRFGWYRSTANATLDIAIIADPLEEETWAEFRELTRVVEYLRPFVIDWLSLAADFETLMAAEDKIVQRLGTMLASGIITVVAGVDANAMAQRRWSNFLGAASAFRDRATRRLAAEFGKSSEEATSFAAAQRRWFDASFAYRCLYHLRNFAQHHELPVSFVPIDARRADDGTMATRVGLQLFPATLAASDKVNAKVRVELQRLPADPLDAIELARDYMRALGALMAVIIGCYMPRLREMAGYAVALYRTLEIPPDTVPVVWEGEHSSGGPDVQRRAIMMGFDELERVLRLHDALTLGAAGGPV